MSAIIRFTTALIVRGNEEGKAAVPAEVPIYDVNVGRDRSTQEGRVGVARNVRFHENGATAEVTVSDEYRQGPFYLEFYDNPDEDGVEVLTL